MCFILKHLKHLITETARLNDILPPCLKTVGWFCSASGVAAGWGCIGNATSASGKKKKENINSSWNKVHSSKGKPKQNLECFALNLLSYQNPFAFIRSTLYKTPHTPGKKCHVLLHIADTHWQGSPNSKLVTVSTGFPMQKKIFEVDLQFWSLLLCLLNEETRAPWDELYSIQALEIYLKAITRKGKCLVRPQSIYRSVTSKVCKKN